jgi:cell filamentation protein
VSRYDLGHAGNSEFEPGSEGGVLRNLLGIKEPREIEILESNLLVLAQARSYRQIETNTSINFALICRLHRSWLGTLYGFAGKLRTVDLIKDGVPFAPIAYMSGSLQNLEEVLSSCTPCQGMQLEVLVRSVARVHAELVLIHPFREGNGRLSRWVADLMVLQAGYPPLEWGFDRETELRRGRYFSALRRGFAMDFTPLEALVEEALFAAIRLAEDPNETK